MSQELRYLWYDILMTFSGCHKRVMLMSSASYQIASKHLHFSHIEVTLIIKGYWFLSSLILWQVVCKSFSGTWHSTRITEFWSPPLKQQLKLILITNARKPWTDLQGCYLQYTIRTNSIPWSGDCCPVEFGRVIIERWLSNFLLQKQPKLFS